MQQIWDSNSFLWHPRTALRYPSVSHCTSQAWKAYRVADSSSSKNMSIGVRVFISKAGIPWRGGGRGEERLFLGCQFCL
jgi:hypothetical protein